MSPSTRWIPVLALAAVFAVALVERVVHFETMPGVSGDEAWYGMQAYRLLHGQSYEEHTPTGLPINPFFFTLEVPLLLLFRPAIWILRLPALVCGIATVALSVVLVRKVFDTSTAWLAAVILAITPILIVYSRFGWDQSQAPLFVLLAWYGAARGWPVRTTLALTACVMVHFINVLAIPIVLPTFLLAVQRDAAATWLRRRGLQAGSVVGMLLAFAWVKGHNPQPRQVYLAALLDRDALGLYLSDLARLFTGDSIREWIVGPVAPGPAHAADIVFGVAALVLVIAGGVRLVRRREWDRLALLPGLVAGTAGLYLSGGPDVLRPLTARYGVVLIVPAAIQAACLVTSLLPEAERQRPGRAGGAMLVATALAAGLALAVWWVQFFTTYQRTGGDAQPWFRAAPVEMKQQALAWIEADIARGGTRPQRMGMSSLPPVYSILAESWWTRNPLIYLALGRPAIRVDMAVSLHQGGLPTEVRSRFDRGGYVVGFEGGPLLSTIREHYPPEAVEEVAIRDHAGRPTLIVARLKRVPESAP